MNNLIEAIDKQASTLPPEFQREVLNYIGYLQTKHKQSTDPAWLDRAWGAAPDFPDRPQQPPLTDVQEL